VVTVEEGDEAARGGGGGGGVLLDGGLVGEEEEFLSSCSLWCMTCTLCCALRLRRPYDGTAEPQPLEPAEETPDAGSHLIIR
jgi:hypothetical protein